MRPMMAFVRSYDKISFFLKIKVWMEIFTRLLSRFGGMLFTFLGHVVSKAMNPSLSRVVESRKPKVIRSTKV